MKSIFLKSALLIVVSAGLLSGCANSDTYDTPNLECVEPGLTATKTVAEIKALAMTVTTPYLYEADDVIEAYVTSSDEKGNIYKSISFQTIPTDGSAPIGFSVPVNVTSTFAEGFTPGTKVYIRLQGLYIMMVYNSLQIGSLYQSSPSEPFEIGRISELEYRDHLIPSCTKIDEDDFVRPMTVAEAFTDANLNTLIELQDVRFVDASVGRTYFDIDSGGGATNHYVTANSGGTSQVVRFSSFAPFSGRRVPGGIGNIRGVLTKFETTYQFMVRYESDIMLTTPRQFVYSGAFTENFETFSANQNSFPNYINDPVIGTKVWSIKTSATKYIEMTSFNSGETNRTLFFVPVNFTDANTITFQYKVNFLSSGHTPLKVYYTNDFTWGDDLAQADLVNITGGFSNLASQTATSFTSAGTYTIPENVTGNGFLIFEYTGSAANPAHTTNLGIDNIVVN
ncbi:MAG TPA: DUF5689 domain-containing protein [Flavobacterium sp.]|jgi:hypothetical protein